MVKKKTTPILVSQEETAQAQHIVEQYHQIATNLHASKTQQEVETALADINALPEGAQIALLKELSKELHVDAADVLVALHEFSPLKGTRKEARRSLIRLEGAKIYPDWELPRDQIPALGLVQPIMKPPRFWKGFVTDTRAQGIVQLFLLWEQGESYREVRLLGFALEFEQTGVRDFFTRVDTKQSFQDFRAQVAAKAPNVTLMNCSLPEARSLLLEAVAVHAQDGTKVSPEYQSNLALINELIMQAPGEDTDLAEESVKSIDLLHDLSPKNVVINFVEAWVDENYAIAYDLLASDSPLREDLAKEEWIQRRETWAKDAFPNALEPNFLVEREQPKSKIWLPGLWSVNYAETHKEVESGWSIELDEIPESGPLPELPQATMIYEQTNRHWFWVTYTLIRENGEWRIQRMTDEGLNAQTLSIEELQAKTDELDSYLREFSQKYTEQDVEQLEEKEAMAYLGQMATYIMQAIGYNDILIKKLPLDRSLYVDASALMVTVGQYERCLAYLTPLIRRFPEQRALFLRRMADVQQRVSEEYFEEDYEERGELYLELAEKSLQESLAVENSIEAHLSLAEMFLDDDERLDEAEDQLLQAKELVTDPADEAHVERHLGEVAMEQDEYQKALSHYQRVIELEPDSANIWSEIGKAHEMLDHFAEAEANYKRAIELQPDNASYYYRLATLYNENNQPSQAIEVIEQGLAANPDSAALYAHKAALYVESDDYEQAEISLSKAEQLNPDSESIKRLRNIFEMNKPKPEYAVHRLGKPGKRGRRGR